MNTTPTAYSIPYVIEKDGNHERVKDIWSKLLESRIIFLGSQVNDAVGNAIVAQLLVLAADDPSKDIFMYINSPGGSVSAGLAIFDTMNYIKPDVSTICVGGAYSMGAFLLAAGAKGKRRATKNSRIMIHQPLSGAQGQITDMEIELKEGVKYKKLLSGYLAKFSGKPLSQIQADTERNFYMTASEAKKYGLIDTVEL